MVSTGNSSIRRAEESIENNHADTAPNRATTDFGVIHEIDHGGPGGNLSMDVHVYGLGVWNFR